jgi:hypothetical protein
MTKTSDWQSITLRLKLVSTGGKVGAVSKVETGRAPSLLSSLVDFISEEQTKENDENVGLAVNFVPSLVRPSQVKFV